MRTLKTTALTICISVLLAGCSGGGKSVLSSAPTAQNPTTQSGAKLVLTGTLGSGPRLFAGVRRLPAGSVHRLALALKSVSVSATLYPGDAGNQIVTNAINILTSTVPASATVSLSNVPVHNNEWVIMQFTGNATDGSQVALGELAGVVNVASSTTNTASLSETTTQTFQVFLDLIENGALSTNDLDTNATLASTLHTDIGATPPDPTTHLFSPITLQGLYNSIAPKFQRNVTIGALPAFNGSFIIVRDYTNTSELDLSSNLQVFFGSPALVVPIPVIGQVIGAPNGEGSFNVVTPTHTQLTNPQPVPAFVNSYVTTEVGKQMVSNVYGGNLLIGATDNTYVFGSTATPPFHGGFIKSAAHAPGSFSVTVPTAVTQTTVSVNDPFGFAFGPAQASFSVRPAFSGPLSGTAFEAGTSAIAYRVVLPTPYSSTSHTLTVDTFNPWDVATTNMQMCGGVLTCWQLGAVPPTIQRPFADPATKLTFFNWKPSGTATAVSQVVPSGYKVTISGAGTATLTTTTASTLLPRQKILISSTSFTPTTWTVTATDGLGNPHTNGAIGSGFVTVEMESVGDTTATTKIAISFTTTVPGSVTINSINLGS